MAFQQLGAKDEQELVGIIPLIIRKHSIADIDWDRRNSKMISPER